MLIALLTVLLLGGGSTGALNYIGDTRDAVKSVVANGDAQKSALKTLKAMRKRTNVQNKMAKRTAKEIEKVFSDHEIEADDLETIWNEYFAAIDSHNQDMLDMRFALKENITREEWTEIFKDTER